VTGIVTREAVDRDVRISCDVVVVGSGAGGATTAATLAEAGIDVVVVEEGGYHPTEEYGTRLGPALRTLYRDGGAQAAYGRPPIVFSEGRCVGGSTVVNGGMSWRTPEAALDRWSRETSISSETMRPYFETVERRLHVALQDPETVGRDSQLLKAGADAKGWTIIPNLRNQLHCAGSNNCTLGCPTGAKRSMLLTHIPRAMSHGARVYADCRVERVTRDGRTATGVEGRFSTGHRLSVTAPVVVVAGGAVQTPALLARSGFRSPSGQLGRNLAMHPNAKLVALFDDPVRGWQGVHQAYQVREFADEGILITAVNIPPALVAMSLPDHGRPVRALMDGYDHMVTAGCLVEDTGTGRVVGGHVFYRLSDRDAAKLVRGIALTAELMFAAGARRILAPFVGVPDLEGPDDIARMLARPVPKRSMDLFTVHLMGTARCSDDPRRGVVSSFGEFHGAHGLYVADASLFPGPIGVNPMETIVALALRNADRLVGDRARYGI
jgi:choline dehydrogenase-like flavoprotein